MPSGMFRRSGQSRISQRWGQTNEIIAELVNYHHFHFLTSCNMCSIMVLDSFIVVFVGEAFGLCSHLLKHIAHPLQCIMEITFVLSLFFTSLAVMWYFYPLSVCSFSNTDCRVRKIHRRWNGTEWIRKKNYKCTCLFFSPKVRAGWSLGRSTHYRRTFQRKLGPVYLLRTTC